MNDLSRSPNGARTLPGSGKIRGRIERAQQRYHANDNIAAFLEPRDLDEVERKMYGVLESLVIDTVRTRLRDWFGDAIDGWRHLKIFRVPDALPLQTPSVEDPRFYKTRRSNWPYVCGEYRNAPTINWALYSGRCAAETIVAIDDRRRVSA